MVFPSDRGHFNYTVHIAAELHNSGRSVEYWAPATAKSYAPDFCAFHALTDAQDDRFDRFTRLFCNLSSHGNTFEDGEAYTQKEMAAALEAEFGSADLPVGLQGTREQLIRMKERVLQPDVALCIFDANHMYKWIGKHCEKFGVPSLGLHPSPIYLWRPESEADFLPDNLGEEPEYMSVRKDTAKVPHHELYTLFPRLTAGCSIPAGRRVVGPVMLPGQSGVPPEQDEAFQTSGLKDWCESSDKAIVYVSFGSMMRGGIAFEIAHRLLSAIEEQPWRILIAANPDLFNGHKVTANVRIEKWVPQAAVLAHRHVKAFISHCGATSVNEAIIHRVPIIAMPFFHDQRFNGPALVACGAATASLLKFSFTAEELVTAVEKAVTCREVATQMNELSAELRAHDGLREVVRTAEGAMMEAQKIA